AAGGAALLLGVERVEIRQLRLAEDLDAARDDAVVVAGEREARLLDARVRHAPPEAGSTADQPKVDGKPPIFEQLPGRHGRAPRRFRVLHAFSFAPKTVSPTGVEKPLCCATLFCRPDEAVSLRPIGGPEKLLTKRRIPQKARDAGQRFQVLTR